MSGSEAITLYASSVLLLERYLRDLEDHGLIRRARSLIQRATQLAPDQARYHALLGYTYDLEDRVMDALACFRRACHLAPGEPVFEVYVVALLVQSGDETKALEGLRTAALHQQVDLDALRAKLRAASFPTDARTLLANGFIHARNYFESWLRGEAERLSDATEPAGAIERRRRELEACLGMQRELQQRFDTNEVPQSFRHLARWAVRFGVGDDPCRTVLLAALSPEEQAEMIANVDGHASAIHEWLDDYADGEMPIEALSFLYLLLGVEEIRSES